MSDLKDKPGGPLQVPTPQSRREYLHIDQSPHTIPMARNNVHFPIIEIVHAKHPAAEKIENRWEQANLGRISMQIVMGGRAFRIYHALSNSVGQNKAGNLRGMVVSSRWRTLFRYTSQVGEYMENIGYLVALAAGITESAPKIESILRTSDPATLKGMRISAVASTLAQRVLLGVIPAGAHMLYRSLEGWCMIAGLAGGKAESAASQCIQTLKYADALIQTGFRAATDTSNQSAAAWWIIDLVTFSRSP